MYAAQSVQSKLVYKCSQQCHCKHNSWCMQDSIVNREVFLHKTPQYLGQSLTTVITS